MAAMRDDAGRIPVENRARESEDETREWMESLEFVMQSEGPGRVREWCAALEQPLLALLEPMERGDRGPA